MRSFPLPERLAVLPVLAARYCLDFELADSNRSASLIPMANFGALNPLGRLTGGSCGVGNPTSLIDARRSWQRSPSAATGIGKLVYARRPKRVGGQAPLAGPAALFGGIEKGMASEPGLFEAATL
jgi:hypothetical protein